MKKRIFMGLTGLLLLMSALTGCLNLQSSDEMQSEILARCSPLAEGWFTENMDDAELLSTELFFISWGEVCFDTVTGQYSRNGADYTYYLNVDTGEFCSEEYYELLNACMEARLTEILTLDYSELQFPLQEAVIHGTVVSDQNLNKKRSELKTYEVSRECFHSCEKFDVNDLAAYTEEKLSETDTELTIYAESAKKVFDDLSQLSFLKEYRNWTLVLKEKDDPSVEYRVYFDDGVYHTARALYDEKGSLRYDISLLEDE